jgi:hypothetical protein
MYLFLDLLRAFRLSVNEIHPAIRLPDGGHNDALGSAFGLLDPVSVCTSIGLRTLSKGARSLAAAGTAI